MTTSFDCIELVSVDKYGCNFEVAGVWNDKPYRIEVSVECDGRDVESEPMTEGEYNPMHDWEDEPAFFDVLCSQQRFIDLHNQGYKAWELMPQD
jgi:hypothetical protein